MPSLDTIAALLSHYGYFLLVPIAIVEGPIITVIAAFLASAGVFNVYIVYMIAVVGDILGDGIWYWSARLGSRHFLRFVLKHGPRLGINEEKVTLAEAHLRNHFWKTIVMGKITNVVMLPIIIASGIIKISYKKFAVAVLSVDIPKDLFFTIVGFYFGKYYLSINGGINKFFYVSTGILLAGLAVFFIIKYMQNQYKKI